MAERPPGESGPGPYEPLYRAGEPSERTDPGWGRHSHPEHDPRDSPVGDRYAWLFRDEDPAPAHAAESPADEEDTSPRMDAVPPPPAPVSPEPVQYDEPEPERRRRGPLLALIIVLVLVLAVAGVLIGRWWLAPRPRTAAPPAGSTAPSTAPSTTPAPSGSAGGSVQPVEPTEVSADCTAPDATDDAGATVSYAAAQSTDGDPATAWRCNGSGVGKTLTFTLPSGTTVTQLGLINGYAKVDPKSRKDRYDEYRRITAVTWTVGDQQVQQELDDGDEELQTVSVDPTETDRVVLTIETSSDPGSSAKTRDAVLISEVQIGATG